MKAVRIPYPWLTILGGLLLIGWQYLLAHPQWLQRVQLAENFSSEEYLLAAILLWLLLIGFDMQRFFRSRAEYRKEQVRYQAKISELVESRRELGTRARTYSSHADKLKLFISDKLLEYIEYDEKFLHFKNIAAEVRHNGVISYDRAQTALKQAADLCASQLEDNRRKHQFEKASESLLYLWDLLDIATTDNIALHVANRVYDCEEYFYQSQLNKVDAPEFPVKPTFSMYSALQQTLMPLVDDPIDFAAKELDGFPLEYLDRRFQLLVSDDCEMLGNRNHMVLLLENLVNNALYYADQRSSKTRFRRVTILQTLQPDQVVLEVYNQGPAIKEEDRERIFQLGYSSRRVRDHHGKGLGLYFVNEICKGFEGMIDFENIKNREDQLSLRVELANGEVENHFVSLVEENGKPLCRVADTEEQPARSQEWSFASPISSIEISAQSSSEIQRIDALADTNASTYQDISDPLLPTWSLDITNRSRSAKMVLRPIDVRGVRFRARFPTAIARLEDRDGVF